MKLIMFLDRAVGKVIYLLHCFKIHIEKLKLAHCGKNVVVHWPNTLSGRISLDDNVNVYGYAKFIIGPGGRFVMKRNAGASQGLTVITGRHGHVIGHWFKDSMTIRERDEESTVTVCEDARLGANVTLLKGVTVGRGAQVGACAVVTRDIPPYAIAAGNPARVLRFIFTPAEIVEHERLLYPEGERLSLEELERMQNCNAKQGSRLLNNVIGGGKLSLSLSVLSSIVSDDCECCMSNQSKHIAA